MLRLLRNRLRVDRNESVEKKDIRCAADEGNGELLAYCSRHLTLKDIKRQSLIPKHKRKPTYDAKKLEERTIFALPVFRFQIREERAQQWISKMREA